MQAFFDRISGYKINTLALLLIVQAFAAYTGKLEPHWSQLLTAVIAATIVVMRNHFTTEQIDAEKKRITVVLAIIAALAGGGIAVSGCASQAVLGGASQRSPLDQAELNYAAASLDYESLMLSAQDLRAARLISDGAWTIIETAQERVRKYQPLVRAGLTLWRASGQKPDSVDSSSAAVMAAIADIRKIVEGAKP